MCCSDTSNLATDAPSPQLHPTSVCYGLQVQNLMSTAQVVTPIAADQGTVSHLMRSPESQKSSDQIWKESWRNLPWTGGKKSLFLGVEHPAVPGSIWPSSPFEHATDLSSIPPFQVLQLIMEGGGKQKFRAENQFDHLFYSLF